MSFSQGLPVPPGDQAPRQEAAPTGPDAETPTRQRSRWAIGIPVVLLGLLVVAILVIQEWT